MRVLVVHASFLGSTAEIAERIAARLEADGFECTVGAVADAGSPAGYDGVVIGSAIHGGHWLPEAKRYIKRNAADLATMPVWLFSSGPVGTDPRYIETDPKDLEAFRRSIHPRGHRVFWGAHRRDDPGIDRLGLVSRLAARRLIPEGDFRDWGAIEGWAAGIARELGPLPILSR